MIHRELYDILKNSIKNRKIIILLGARQTGKTTLLKTLIAEYGKTLWFNADEYDIRQLFEKPNSVQLKSVMGDAEIVVIDEAQRLPNVGIGLKLLYDNYPELKILVTGSSAFELRNKMNEPLTGRKSEWYLFPLSFGELTQHHGLLTEKRHLGVRLVYGSYPEIVMNPGHEKALLYQLADSYLFKDILMIENIKKPDKLVKLLQALALQLGSEVSYNEIGNLIGLDSKTVESYINLLEKYFIVFKLNSLSRNARNELKLSKKIYFFDNGIRNAVISNFQNIESRQDTGPLFENYLISERIKANHYHGRYTNIFFWRTKDKQEIDFIEERDGKLYAFEFKWSERKKASLTKTFSNAYPNAEFKVVNRENYHEFLNFG
jgi:uncharacterized protein